MDDKLYTAAEISAMKLPGLPTTKPSLLARAEKEDWYFEVRLGLGGRRKVFKIPELYLPGFVPPGTDNPTMRERQEAFIEQGAERIASNAVNAMGEQVDPERLALAITYVDTYLLDHKIHLSTNRRSEIIVVVYNFLKGNTGQMEVNNLIRLVA